VNSSATGANLTTHAGTSMLEVDGAQTEFLTTGSGAPATVFAHGLAGSIQTTRPFGSGVRGSRTFMHFRGHGASTATQTPWTYPALAQELRAVADHVGATQALGVSMGAGALCNLLAHTPGRFERLVFVMPAALDTQRADLTRSRLVAMADHAENGDVDALATLLLEAEPRAVRAQPAVQLWCRRQARTLVGTTISQALRALPTAIPVSDRGLLSAVTAPALVIAQEDDPLHPVWVAEELAASLPVARLEVLAPGGVMWRHRARLRELVGSHLGAEGTSTRHEARGRPEQPAGP
jgi:pimeloyl-ACP methyl ester carboxylesterase